MVYIDSNGSVYNSRPWSLQRLVDIFWGFLNVIYMFFLTLFDTGMNKHGSSYSRNYRGGGGPPKPPQKRMGGINTLADCNIPGGGG